MIVTAIEVYVDKEGKQHNVGDTYEIKDNKRVANLLERKLIKVAEAVTVETPATTKRKRKAIK